MLVDSSSDRPSCIRSLVAYHPGTRSFGAARVADFAALLQADFASTSTIRLANGETWELTVGVEEAVGLLRCLEELSAVYAGTDLARVLDSETARLRRRLADDR